MQKSKKETVAMLLAGGQGSRLRVLTKYTAKPAIPFGGKYRIIDFTLSNCINSGIDTVGVLTQYEPLELNSYIGNGIPWDLNRIDGGVSILPPYVGAQSGEWYTGTANAVYQNIRFIEKYDPEYVVILSGDHIYKMDYSEMVDFHKKTGAACTIAALPVPIEEASRFGIMNTEPDGRIYEFEEKPAHPKCNNASMGIYVFSWDKLRKYLTDDAERTDSKHDFGGDIIPGMIAAGERLMAYRFEGYWKDVGTIDSFWEANMDLLNPRIPLNLSDPDWRIYSRFKSMVPQYIGKNAKITESMVTESCRIDGSLWYSVLFSGVEVAEGASLNSCVVMSNTRIGKNADIKYAIIADDVVIEDGAVIGDLPENSADPSEWGIAVIGTGAVVKAGQVVKAGEMIEPYNGREEAAK